MLKWLILGGLVAYILLEIALVVEAGHVVGMSGVLIWTVGTAVAGLLLLRIEGVRGIVRIHRQLQQEVLPTKELVDMALVVMGGVLMISPGLVADFVGVLLLIPPARWGVRGLFFMTIARLLDSKPSGPIPPSREVIEVTAKRTGD
jgi:UPF0716 protein FxsA